MSGEETRFPTSSIGTMSSGSRVHIATYQNMNIMFLLPGLAQSRDPKMNEEVNRLFLFPPPVFTPISRIRLSLQSLPGLRNTF
jgi:hypothetical protein